MSLPPSAFSSSSSLHLPALGVFIGHHLVPSNNPPPSFPHHFQFSLSPLLLLLLLFSSPQGWVTEGSCSGVWCVHCTDGKTFSAQRSERICPWNWQEGVWFLTAGHQILNYRNCSLNVPHPRALCNFTPPSQLWLTGSSRRGGGSSSSFASSSCTARDTHVCT